MNRYVVTALVLVSWLPIAGPAQVVAYLGPLAVIAVALGAGVVRLAWIDLLFLSATATLVVAVALFHQDTGLLHPLLGLLTYSSALVLTLRGSGTRPGSTESALATMLTATAWVSIAETALGTLQLALLERGTLIFSDPSSGDFVVGTLGTNSHLFAVKMLFQGLVLFVGWRNAPHYRPERRRLLLCGAGAALFSGLLASALLATASFFTAMGMWYLWSVVRSRLAHAITLGGGRPPHSLKPLAIAAAGMLTLGLSFYLTQRANAELIAYTIRGVWRGDIRPPKAAAFEESIERVWLADPVTAVFGTGLGRFSSRAAMLLSGGYLKNQPPWMPVSRSQATHRTVYSRWRASQWPQYRGSIIGMPTSTVQSVLVEFGLAGTALVLWYLGSLLRRARALRHSLAPGRLQHAFVSMLPLILLCLLAVSFTDLWLEYASFMTFINLTVAATLDNGR